MALNRLSRHSLILIATICALGGFLAGSSRSQVQPGEPAGEVGRYQYSIDVRVMGDKNINNYFIFDTKTACAWEMDVRLIDDEGVHLQWKRIPSPFDPVQTVGLAQVKPPAPNPGTTSKSN